MKEELFGDLHEQEENGLFGRRHKAEEEIRAEIEKAESFLKEKGIQSKSFVSGERLYQVFNLPELLVEFKGANEGENWMKDKICKSI